MNSITLSWRVKDSFVEYVRQLADGVITRANGAVEVDAGDFVFSLRDQERSWTALASSDAYDLRFTGNVLFEAHGGMLKLPLVDPWILGEPDHALLTIVDPLDDAERIVFAVLRADPTNAESEALRFTASASDFACELMGNVYPVGTDLSPVFVRSK